MKKSFVRRPIGNFFIKPALQIRLILKIVFAVLISTLVSSGSLILVYYLKYDTVIVYQLDKVTQELSREHIIFLILPTLVISAVVSILVALGVGFYASRKYAVPIYKLEKWANLLGQGKLTAALRFREKEEMKDLSDKCNTVTDGIRGKFLSIRKKVDFIKQTVEESTLVKEIETILDGMELEANPIEVTTTFYSLSHDGQAKKKT
jgi:methyl-accepting chemotaxis protein